MPENNQFSTAQGSFSLDQAERSLTVVPAFCKQLQKFVLSQYEVSKSKSLVCCSYQISLSITFIHVVQYS